MRRVAIILSVYSNDKIELLQLAIESILCQSERLNLIIPIDGQNDKKKHYLLSTLGNGKVTILNCSQNRGLAAFLNDAIDYCINRNYDFIARMDVDDIFVSDRIQKQLA